MNPKKKRMKPLRFVKKYGRVLIGAVIIAVVLFCAVFAPLLTDCDPEYIDMLNAKQRPSQEHIMGTDTFGRDIWARILFGSRNTLLVAILTQLAVTVVGTVFGLLCGYFRTAEKFLMRFLDAYATIPSLLMNLLIVSVLGSGVGNLVLAMTISAIPGVSRAVRNQVLFIREKEYIERAKAMGASSIYTLFRHVLPNISNYLLVRLGGGLAGSIGTMTGLSFLGLGLDPMIASWGGIVQDGQGLMFVHPHLSFFAVGVICITVFGFVMLGDGLRDLLDPRLK